MIFAAVSTCDSRCLCADRFHTGLCITADGPAPPSIKRQHKRFKAAGRAALNARDFWASLGPELEADDSEDNVHAVKRMKLLDELCA